MIEITCPACAGNRWVGPNGACNWCGGRGTLTEYTTEDLITALATDGYRLVLPGDGDGPETLVDRLLLAPQRRWVRPVYAQAPHQARVLDITNGIWLIVRREIREFGKEGYWHEQ